MASKLQTASFVAIGCAIFFAQWARQPPALPPTFEEVRPSLYRLNYYWGMLPGFPPIPVATWLVESSTLLSPKSWALIDAGTDHTGNQEAILQGIKSKLATAGGSLKTILLTHGHADHVGALAKLIEAYPDADIVYHENEEPFISGGAQYTDLVGDNLPFNLARKVLPAINSSLLPSSEAIKLQGSSGDVATYIKWMSKDILQYYAVPGHTPGMVAYYHKPTKSVIAADSFMHVSSWFPFTNSLRIEPGIPLRLGTQSLKRTKESQVKLAGIADATTYFASHDLLEGTSGESFRSFVSSW